jgi:hypothetical protein
MKKKIFEIFFFQRFFISPIFYRKKVFNLKNCILKFKWRLDESIDTLYISLCLRGTIDGSFEKLSFFFNVLKRF